MPERTRQDISPRRPRPPQRPKLRNQLLIIFGILALAAGSFYTALVVITQIDQIFFPGSEIKGISLGGINLPGVDKGADDKIGGRRINVLVMGLDRRPREGKAPARTDTMFVMTIDPQTRSARGLAMPRDLWVDIPGPRGKIQNRINAAYIIGETGDYPGGGVATVRKTVENLLGIKIDYHVIIDFEGFKEIIDALGGVDVNVLEPGVNDPLYSETELPGDYFPCVFKPGLYHMNGSQALCYARVRRGSDDRDRIIRQQNIIWAVIQKATSLNIISSPKTMVDLWRKYKDAIETDVSDLQIPGFAELASRIDQNSIAFLSLGPATTATTIGDASVLVPSQEGIKQIVEAFTSDNRLEKENASIEIQNGSGVEGQATKAMEYFSSFGIPKSLVTVANAAAAYQESVIVYFTGKSYTAQRLAGWLDLPSSRVREGTNAEAALRSNPEADILVILGADAKIDDVAATSAGQTTR